MKNWIKQMFVILVMLFTITFTFAQTGEPEPESVNVVNLIIKIFVATLGGAFITAINHIMAWTFSWTAWWKDTLRPAVITFGVAMVLLGADYVPILDNLLESYLGVDTDKNEIDTILVAALVLVPIVKGFFKRKDTKAKVQARKIEAGTLKA